LPDDMQWHVQGGARQQQCWELVAAADVIWQARMQKKLTNMAAALHSQIEEVTEAVAAVQLNTNRQDKSSGSHRGQ